MKLFFEMINQVVKKKLIDCKRKQRDRSSSHNYPNTSSMKCEPSLHSILYFTTYFSLFSPTFLCFRIIFIDYILNWKNRFSSNELLLI